MRPPLAALAATLSLSAAAPALAQGDSGEQREYDVAFVAIGDTGYIPAYDQLDEDDERFRTLGAYLGNEASDWLEHNRDLSQFRPTPWQFEPAIGGFVPASGMYPVAMAAAEVCAHEGCDFGAILGDNIYPDGATLGADGISDERRFREMLDQPYGKFGAGTPGFTLYAMMGNHDWHISREATDAQLAYLQAHPNFTMPDLFYSAVPAGMEGELEIFVIDTEMLLAGTEVRKDALDADGNELQDGGLDEWPDYVRASNAEEANMVGWLTEALAASQAKWKIVMGHHALWSSGGSKYEKARSLRRLLLDPICRYADAYIAGDDHLIEAYSDDCSLVAGAPSEPVPMFVSGAGSKYRQQHVPFAEQQIANNPQMRNLFSRGSTWGFLHVGIAGDELVSTLYSTPADQSGRPVEEARFTFPHRSR
ncbi:metallophosphoesterase [Aurantiacibacter suaedae]|uniref:metallophosphoesterase n=1 Tax=Aurantiacibacter suaedae TaxID=2545755 RepID=UPI0010F70E99|nr:metallophosphoesterase [Aurantiacibacter suaedae]